jgi:hypothetical protein
MAEEMGEIVKALRVSQSNGLATTGNDPIVTFLAKGVERPCCAIALPGCVCSRRGIQRMSSTDQRQLNRPVDDD